MCSQWAALAMSVVAILSAVAKPLAPPTTGWLYNTSSVSFIFPLTATQCEPFNIFYNSTDGDFFLFNDATDSHTLIRIYFPRGTGYLEWICNIPAGFAFFVGSSLNYIVQPGLSSACLGNLNTTYSDLSYYTTKFESFTRNPSPLVTSLPTITFPTTTFPTGTFSTITLNPNLAVTPTTSPPVTSSANSPPSPTTPPPPTSPPSPTPTPSHKSRNAAVAGGVVGAVAFVLLIVALMLWRRRRSSFQASASSPIDPPPASISGLTTSELEPTDLSSPFRRSGTEPLGRTHTPDGGAAMAPMANNPAAIAVPIGEGPEASPYAPPLVSQRPSQGTITPFVAEPALPSQRPRKPRNNERQSSQPSPPLDLPSRTPPTAERQPPYIQSPNTPVDAALETSRPDAVPLFQQSSTNEAQEGPLDFAAVLGVISRAQLSETERLAAVRNLLISDPSGQHDLARQNTVSSPPPYAE